MIPAQPFTSARSELPMLYVLLGLGSVELLVVHLIASLWSPAAAWVLSALTLLGVVQIVAIVRRVKNRPTLVTADGLSIRSAKGFDVALSWDRIATIAPIGFSPAPVGDDVMKAALLAHPNIHVTVTRPFTVRRLGRARSAGSVTLRVDQPDALIDVAGQARRAGTGTDIR